jgi:hypothetical protein
MIKECLKTFKPDIKKNFNVMINDFNLKDLEESKSEEI